MALRQAQDRLFRLGWVLPAGGGYHLAPSGLVALHALGARSQELATHTIYSFCTDETEGRHHPSAGSGQAFRGSWARP